MDSNSSDHGFQGLIRATFSALVGGSRRTATTSIDIDPDYSTNASGDALVSLGGGTLEQLRLEQRLAFLGFPDTSVDLPVVDGVADPATAESLQLFQAATDPDALLNPGTASGTLDAGSVTWLNHPYAPRWIELVDPDPQSAPFNVSSPLGAFDFLPARDPGTGVRSGNTPQAERFGTDWLLRAVAAAANAVPGIVINGLATDNGVSSEDFREGLPAAPGRLHRAGLEADIHVPPGARAASGGASLGTTEQQMVDIVTALHREVAKQQHGATSIVEVVIPNSKIRTALNTTLFGGDIVAVPGTVQRPYVMHVSLAASDHGLAAERLGGGLGEVATSIKGLVADFLSSTPSLNSAIPAAGATLDDLFGVSRFLGLGDAIEGFLAATESPSADGLRQHLESSWIPQLPGEPSASASPLSITPVTTSGRVSGLRVDFDRAATSTRSLPLGLPEAVMGVGPALVPVDVEISTAFGFGLTVDFGTDEPGFEFDLVRFELDAAGSLEDVVLPLRVGDLEATAGHPQFDQGSLSLGIHADVTLDPVNGLTLVLDPVGDPVSAIDLDLPLYAFLAGEDLTQGLHPSIGVSGDLFVAEGRGSTPIASTPSNLDDLAAFATLTVDDLVARLEALRDDWLAEFSRSSSFDIAIPFVDVTLGEALDFGRAFDFAVLEKLDLENVDTLQDFVAAVTRAAVLPDGESVTYDPATQELRIPIEFDIELDELSLRDLDVLGLVDLATLVTGGLVQFGDQVDLDDLLDNGFATLADLVAAGVLSSASVGDWNAVDEVPIAASGRIGVNGLALHGLVDESDMVDLDELLLSGLATLADVVEAEVVTLGSIVGNLGFIREVNALATNIADFGFQLTSLVESVDLVSIADIIGNGLATLEELFDADLIDLGDLGITSLDPQAIIDQAVASLSELILQGLVTAADFVESTVVDLSDLVDTTAVQLVDLIDVGLVAANDFAQATLVDVGNLLSGAVADLGDLVEDGFLELGDFVDIAIAEAALLASGLLTPFEIDFNDLADEFDNVSLHDLVNSELVTLEELAAGGLITAANVVGSTSVALQDLAAGEVASLRDLVTGRQR